MEAAELEMTYRLTGMDFANAGRASTNIKEILKRLGFDPAVVRRVAITSYEAEMNVVIYAERGTMRFKVSPGNVEVEVADEGPGIPDINLAMQEGYSTAPDRIREMGFGAGMGLPNIKRNADHLDIESTVGRGTTLRFSVRQR